MVSSSKDSGSGRIARRGRRSPQEADELRLIVRIARLYHEKGLGQPEISRQLNVSQARVSRTLKRAESLGIVRTTVVVPEGIYDGLESELESKYGLRAVYVVDVPSDREADVERALGDAAAFAVGNFIGEAKVVGFSSWSSTLGAMADVLPPTRGKSVTQVVELLGGIGHPIWQHEAARATQRVAECWDARPVFLRVPGVLATPELREAMIGQDPFAREALDLLDELDMALIGIGPSELSERLHKGGVDFTDSQLDTLAGRDVVGNINLRFFESDGTPLESSLDDLVIGMTLRQLRKVPVVFAVAGGITKRRAIHAALLGGYVNVLVLDEVTARWLAAETTAAG